MIINGQELSSKHCISICLTVVVLFVVGMHVLFWQEYNNSIAAMQEEISQYDKLSGELASKLESLHVLEREVENLRHHLSHRLQQFPENLEVQNFRKAVVDVAKRKDVHIRLWKPEMALLDLQNSEDSIPISLKLEGDFESIFQFLDELRQIQWIQTFSSLSIFKKEGQPNSSQLITHIRLLSMTPLKVAQVHHLLEG